MLAKTSEPEKVFVVDPRKLSQWFWLHCCYCLLHFVSESDLVHLVGGGNDLPNLLVIMMPLASQLLGHRGCRRHSRLLTIFLGSWAPSF